jgi:O-antigen/teichoic acid export membrane protein
MTRILLLLSLTFPIACSATVHQALLERDSNFSVIARIEATATVTALTLAIAAAYLGAGAYSLVIQILSLAVVSSIQLWLASEWKPRWGWGREEWLGLWRFGRNLVGFNMVNYFSRNVDRMVIGRSLGPGALGVYSVAYRLMLFPVQNLTFVANRALFPLVSRQQATTSEFGDLYLRMISLIAFFTAPMMAGLFVLREPFVHVVLGPKWAEVADLIRYLAPIGFIQSLLSTTGTVFAARNRTSTLFRLGVFSAAVQVSAFLIGVRWGLLGVASCYMIANVIVAIPIFVIALRLMDRRPTDLAAAIWRPGLVALVMAFSMVATRWAVPGLANDTVFALATMAALGTITYVLVCSVVSATVMTDALRLLSKR